MFIFCWNLIIFELLLLWTLASPSQQKLKSLDVTSQTHTIQKRDEMSMDPLDQALNKEFLEKLDQYRDEFDYQRALQMIGQSNDDRIWQPRVSESSKYRSEKSNTKGCGIDLFGDSQICEHEHTKCADALQEYFEDAKGQSKVINHKANRKRAALKNALIFPGQKSEDIVHGDGDSKQCFEKNSNYKMWVKDTNSTVGTGPCAKWFKGEDCPFYPEFTIRQEFKVSCKDTEDSYCECIWFCWNNKDVYEMFDSTLESEEFEDCTTSVKSKAEGLAWKEEQCKASKQSEKYKENKKKCMKKKDTERCSGVGKCFLNSHENRSICKYCYRWQCEKDHQEKVLDNECKKRTNPGKCFKYFRTLLDQGKDVEKIFKLQKLKREPCKSKKCKNKKEKKGKKMKKKLKRELQKKNKKTNNGPRFRSAKKESISKKKGPNYANSNVIPPWQKGELTVMPPRPMNSRPPHLYKHISEYYDGYNHPYGFARQKNHRSGNGHNFQQPPSRRNG